MHPVHRVFAGLMLLSPAQLAAQNISTTTVPDAPSCARCTITLRTIATLAARGSSPVHCARDHVWRM